MSRFSDNCDEVIAELREILANMRARKRDAIEGEEIEGPKKKKTRRGHVEDNRRPFNLSGDALFGFAVEEGGGRRKDDKIGSPDDCKRLGNDAFSIRLYLQCRCSRGDSQACKALSEMGSR